MSNIFNKTASDYRYLTKLKDKGLLGSHIAALQSQGKSFDFTRLRDSQSQTNLQLMQSNTQYMQAEIEEVLYRKYNLNTFIPVNKTVPPGALSFGYKVSDSFGEAGFIDGAGSNANTLVTTLTDVTTQMFYGGIMASWTTSDIEQARFANFPLQTKTIKDGTTACLRHIQKVALNGDKNRKVTGLLNDLNIPIVKATTKLEKEVDPVATINGYINSVVLNTNNIFETDLTEGLTIYLPVTLFNYLATTKYSTGADKSMMDYLKKFNAWTIETGSDIAFKSLVELETASTTGSNRVMIGFNNEDVMEIAISKSPNIISVQERGFEIIAPMNYSFSQLSIKHPKACLYIDFPK